MLALLLVALAFTPEERLLHQHQADDWEQQRQALLASVAELGTEPGAGPRLRLLAHWLVQLGRDLQAYREASAANSPARLRLARLEIEAALERGWHLRYQIRPPSCCWCDPSWTEVVTQAPALPDPGPAEWPPPIRSAPPPRGR